MARSSGHQVAKALAAAGVLLAAGALPHHEDPRAAPQSSPAVEDAAVVESELAAADPYDLRPRGKMIMVCGLVRERGQVVVNRNDPILFPDNAPTPSPHLHWFFGNARTTASPADAPDGTPMERGADGRLTPTTCQNSNDTGAYWTPALYKEQADGRLALLAREAPTLQASTHIKVYYVNAMPHDGAELSAVPDGTMMVAGYPHAMEPPWAGGDDTTQQVFWDCGSAARRNTDGTSTFVASPISKWPYACHDSYSSPPGPYPLTFRPRGAVAHINFPSCLKASRHGPNGNPLFLSQSVDRGGSPDDYDLTYADELGRCTAGHTHMPRINIRLHTQDMNPCAQRPARSDAEADALCPPDDLSKRPGDILYRFRMADGSAMDYYTVHADYWNTWHEKDAPNSPRFLGTLSQLTSNCLRARLSCEVVADGDYPLPTPPQR